MDFVCSVDNLSDLRSSRSQWDKSSETYPTEKIGTGCIQHVFYAVTVSFSTDFAFSLFALISGKHQAHATSIHPTRTSSWVPGTLGIQ